MSAVKDMIEYLRRPHLVTTREALTLGSAMSLIKLLGFALLMLPVLGLFMGVLFAATGVTLPEPSREFSEVMLRPNFIVLAAIIAPLTEELIFRSWLGKRGGVLWVAPLLLAGFALYILVSSESVTGGAFLAVMLTVAGSFILYVRRYLSLRRDEAVLNTAILRVFPFAFWGTSIGFGLMHLANYEAGEMGVLLPLLVLPQFMIGVMLGYIRMRFGLFAAMVFHGAYNAVLLTVFTALGQASA